MSRGTNLQEMEVGTKQSRTAVNANAKAGDTMPAAGSNASGVSTPGQTGGWEDLGGPTPQNYKSDDDSSKLKEPSLKTVRDVVNRGAKAAEAMHKMKEDEDLSDEDVISEDEVEDIEGTMEIVSEEEKGEKKEEKKSSKKGKKEDKEGKGNASDDDDAEEGAEDEDGMKEEYSIEEDVNALLAGEELSEEFQEKARTIFEAALRSKVNDIKEALDQQYEERLAEEVLEIATSLQERVDAYLEYVADEWMSENQLSVESGLKEELTDSFLSGLKGLFEEHYVSIPEDKYDVLDSMVEKLDEMEEKLNEQIEKNISLNKRLAESVADGIFDEISEGLALSQKDKLASLAESVEFESEEQYREKLETLKESYFPSKTVSPQAKTETLSEGVDVESVYYSDSMNAYLKTLSAFRQN